MELNLLLTVSPLNVLVSKGLMSQVYVCCFERVKVVVRLGVVGCYVVCWVVARWASIRMSARRGYQASRTSGRRSPTFRSTVAWQPVTDGRGLALLGGTQWGWTWTSCSVAYTWEDGGGREEREGEGREEIDNVTIMAGAKMQRVGIN